VFQIVLIHVSWNVWADSLRLQVHLNLIKVLSNQIAPRQWPIEFEDLQVWFSAVFCSPSRRAVKKENLGIANILIAARLLIRTLTQMRNCSEARM